MADVSTAEETSADHLFPIDETPARRVHSLLHRYPALSPMLVLVLACLVFGFANSRFIQPTNLSIILQQAAVVGALAVGQTLIILTAGIDLSVGAIMVLSSLVMAKLVSDGGLPGIVALLVGFAVAVVAALLNGLLVTKINLPPFIVTLGTLSIFTAATLIYAQGMTISLTPGGVLTWTGRDISLGGFHLTVGVLMMLALYALSAYALRQTAWGKHLYATGDDVEAARLAGIRTNRVLLSAYVVAGAVFGIAAWILVGRINGADPNAGLNANLESITAVVIGGTSLFGGRGAVVGSLIGALIVQVFDNGLALAGMDPNYQVLAVGLLVIAAVAADQWIRSVKS
ncbi:fructose transport system permease protein [Nocardioides panaciterrulae]|uniref:Fructose transport system permease protein n=2 Tax=Nocardioides panaciterrulae TaxID=661492 RepID=A0A7Y9E910_9ACTN|nr:fructose transport system permease protein [Nocardioides panaciterrulae]